jgi:hypothetical protein
MKTRAGNKEKRPAASVMTPAQLAAAGISDPRPKKPQKKPTKDQRIAALEENLRITRELLQTVIFPPLLHFRSLLTMTIAQNLPSAIAGSGIGMASQSPNDGGDTEPATDDDETYPKAGSRKRSSRKLPGAGARCIDSSKFSAQQKSLTLFTTQIETVPSHGPI